MKKSISLALALTLVSAAAWTENWPRWRGPDATGVAPEGNPPITWSETENVKWKVPMPDNGDCTPIIWEDRIFIQVAVPMEEGAEASRPNPPEIEREIFMPKPTVPYDFRVMCLSREDGSVIWDNSVRKEYPHEGFHPSGSLASYSPVTDGEYVWFSFGTRGLHCFTVDGEYKWSSELCVMYTLRAFGEGASPAIVGDKVVVVADHEGESKIFAFDKLTGEKLWERDRDERSTWATPVPATINGRTEILTNGTTALRSYNPDTGDLLWTATGMTQGAIPSPVLYDGKAIFVAGFQDPMVMSIALGQSGDLTNTDALVWSSTEAAPYISSPLLYGDRIYMFDNLKPNMTSYDASSGRVIFAKERIAGLKQIYASPLGVADRIYVMDRKGNTAVLKHGDEVEVLAMNELDDDFDASPVVAGDELFLKGAEYLYCIAED